MPFPAYIVCCESVSEDATTGRITLNGVVDRLVGVKSVEDSPTKPLKMAVVAAWAKSDGDKVENEFVSELRLAMPDGTEYIYPTGKCAFGESKRLFRLVVNLHAELKCAAYGWMTVESRIRPDVEGSDWIVQRYLIILEEMVAAAPAPA